MSPTFSFSNLFREILDNGAINRLLKTLLPVSLRRWLQAQKWKLKVSAGVRLVPEEALTDRYREALLWLINQELDGSLSLGDYLEFGVFNGTSLYCMHRASQELGLERMRLFGFDSFEGLPDSAAIDGWIPGDFHIEYGYTRSWLTRRGVDWNRTFLVKGWFSETLTQALAREHKLKKASVIMIDCDAYQSTKEALTFCASLIGQCAVIFFDDWNSGGRADQRIGEKLAFEEFLHSNPDITFDKFGGYNEKSFVVTIRRNGVQN